MYWTVEMEFYIFLTKDCNLKCSYCTTSDKGARNGELDVQTTAEFVLRNVSGHQDHIVFYGGEPLLKQEWIRDFIKSIKHRNGSLEYTLQTNGVLLNKIDNFILENLNFLNVSIDGVSTTNDFSRGSGIHDRVLSNFNEIKPRFKGTSLARMTLVENNPLFDSVMHLLNHFDSVYWQISNPFAGNYDNFKKEYEKDLQQIANFWIENLEKGKVVKILPFQGIVSSLLGLKKYDSYRCGAGTSLITIDTDGSCYSCDQLLTPEFKVGSIDGNIEQKILSTENYDKFCSLCDIIEVCCGRCYEEAVVAKEEEFVFYCDMTRILVNTIKERLPRIKSTVERSLIDKKDLIPYCYSEEIP
jgi:putative peptide-modifying radical SAM enzyme